MNHSNIKSNANQIKPLQQGHLDYLCGLYAAINAIRFADRFSAENKNLRSVLGSSGFDFLTEKKWLSPATRYGMKISRQRKLSKHLVAEFNSRYSSKLVLNRLPPDVCVKSFIFSETTNSNPVVVCFGGGMEHYSVVTEITEKRMFLFDSNGRKWIKTCSVGLFDNSSGHWYRIYRNSVFSVVRI